MKKCDMCNRPATVHVIEIVNGQAIEKHLCDIHAAETGVVESTPQPLEQLVKKFVNQTGGGTSESSESESDVQTLSHDPRCPSCGLTFTEFRKHGVLGCPQCYEAFDHELMPLLSRAHEGATHHVGKMPRRTEEDSETRYHRMIAIRRKMDQAVKAEEYELAAQLRNELDQLQASLENEN